MNEPVELAPNTLGALVSVITGGPHLHADQRKFGPYISGPELIDFFRPFGGRKQYDSDFGSRVGYASEQLQRLNGTERMADVVEAIVDPRRFIDAEEHSVKEAVKYVNRYLYFEKLKLVPSQGRYRLRPKGGLRVARAELGFVSVHGRHKFIDDQLSKCEQRLDDEDYKGAITAARTLVEEVLVATEALLDSDPPSYNGKLSPLYSRVFRLLNLDPSQEGLHDSSREVLSGLISVVSGLAPMRNKASDAHPSEYRPYRHHAELAVNSAKTIVNFIDGTLTYQLEKGYVQVPGEPDE